MPSTPSGNYLGFPAIPTKLLENPDEKLQTLAKFRQILQETEPREECTMTATRRLLSPATRRTRVRSEFPQGHGAQSDHSVMRQVSQPSSTSPGKERSQISARKPYLFCQISGNQFEKRKFCAEF